MKTEQQFLECLAWAKAIVSEYRSKAPAGCDPVAMGGDSGGGPQPMSYGQQITSEVGALTNLQPTIYSGEATYDPAYAGLELQNMDQFLYGTPDEDLQVPYQASAPQWKNMMTGQIQDTPPTAAQLAMPGFGNAGIGGKGGVTLLPNGGWQQITGPTTRYRTQHVKAQPGYLSILGNVQKSSDDMMAASQTRQRSANINDIATLGPQAMAAFRLANPGASGSVDQYTKAAQGDAALGYSIPPGMAREIEQSVRSRQVGRLGGTGNAGAYEEALGIGSFGDQLYQQRMANLSNAASMNENYYGTGFSQVFGQPWQNQGQADLGAAYGVSQGAGPKYFRPTVNASNAFDTAFNAQQADYISGKNNDAAMAGAGISAAGTAVVGIALL